MYTFLLTDIEGSTKLWEQHPEAMHVALLSHDAMIADGIARHNGKLIKSRGEGDSHFAVFQRPLDAVVAACSLQIALCTYAWPEAAPIHVRMAVHMGDAEWRHDDYYGTTVNRCARLRALAHGGQVLLSRAIAETARDHFPEQISLRPLGAYPLPGLRDPEVIFQVLHPDLPADFPPLFVPTHHGSPGSVSDQPGGRESPPAIRVLIVDDHGVVRHGMRAFLSLLADIQVVGEAADGQQALDQLALLESVGTLPDVVLMDLHMPRMDGIAATAAIKARYPGVAVLALTSFIEEAKVHAALKAGANGYLLKDAAADEVASAIRAVHSGKPFQQFG